MAGRLATLLSEPPVQTGLALGGIAALRAYQPSLIDRSRRDQALIVAASLATGYTVGNLVERAIGVVTRGGGGRRALGAAALGAAAVAAGRSATSPPVRTASNVTAAASIVSASLSAVRLVPPGMPMASFAEALALGAAGGVALSRQLRSYPADGKPTPPPKEVAMSLAQGSAIAAAAWTVLAAERGLARSLAAAGSRYIGGPRSAWLLGIHATLAATAAAATRAGAGRLIHRLDAAGERVEPGYSTPPTSPHVSGGPHSAVRYQDLGLQGRRFVSEATPARAINLVMGVDDAVDPIRIYVGLDSASDMQRRVDLALTELRRTGAFDRAVLIIGSPSGTGYFNYIPVEAAEYFTRGNVASVAVQYGKRPSLLSADRIPDAQRQYLALVEAVSDAVARRPASRRPRVVLYGESLGAQTGQDAFPNPGSETLADRTVARALWVGTPYPTRFRRAVLSANPSDPRFGQAASAADFDPGVEFAFLDHHEDPVTRFNVSIAWKQPPWLGPVSDRPPTVSRTQRWVPGVTFWQTAFDTKNAARVIPGEFKAWGHDYRADLAESVRAAYAIPDVSDAQMAAVERALRRSEIERAARNEGG